MADRPRATTPPRVALRHPDELDAPARALYDSIVGGPRKASLVPVTDASGRLVGPFGLMLMTPEIGEAVQGVGAALRFGATLPARTRELAILTVAAESRSEFEWLAHERQALADGVTEAELEALLDGAPTGAAEETDRCVVDVARALVRHRRLSDEEYADARTRLGEETLAELVWLCGYYQMLALALEVFSPPVPEELRQR